VDEAFVGENDLSKDLKETKSGHKVEWIEEANYFFRLKDHKAFLENFL
jgi:methionyl-tRNA synthetase